MPSRGFPTEVGEMATYWYTKYYLVGHSRNANMAGIKLTVADNQEIGIHR
jgi:hypothetical protein